MTSVLSQNTQAILLLTAPLLAGRGAAPSELLTPGEYKRLARHLREIGCQPADLISLDAADVLRTCDPVIEESRLQKLLGRGFLLSQVVERWQARAIWVVSRADAEYPRYLKARLREDAPPVLYGCGDMGLLDRGGLAVVGSRNVDDALYDYAMAVGRLTAGAGHMLVSGGAKGIDQAAMRGALEGGGLVCGVLADSLEKTTMNREHRNLLLDGQLVLVSPYDPNAGFNVGHAMQRNKLIYALGDAALVVNTDLNKGGTWAGAVEQLDKLRYVPVFVRSTGEASVGLDALEAKGALPWPNPRDTVAFEEVLNMELTATSPQPRLAPGPNAQFPADSSLLTEADPVAPAPQESTPARAAENSPQAAVATAAKDHASVADVDGLPSATSNTMAQTGDGEDPLQPGLTPAEVVFAAVRKAIRQQLHTPMKDAEVAEALDVSPAQAKAWLQRLVDEGVIEKSKKPAGYVVRRSTLFE